MKNAWIRSFLFFPLLFIFASCSNSVNNTPEDNPVFKNPPLHDITEQIKKNPNDADLYYNRGRLLERMENDSLALADYRKAVSLDSSKARYYSAVGDLLFEHKDITGSVKWIERALKLNPKDPAAHLKMAKLFIYTKDYNTAFNEINTVLRQDVYNSEGYFLKGMIYKDLKDTAHARSSFQTAITIAPDYKDAVVQLGLMYSAQKDPLALKYFDNAAKLDTTDLFPLFAKGVFYQDAKEYEKAKEIYKSVILHDNQYTDAYYNTGYILMQQDSVEKAWRQYDLLSKIDPTDPEAYYNRGLCSEMMGKKQDAVADYRQALTFDKNYADAIAALKRLQGK